MANMVYTCHVGDERVTRGCIMLLQYIRRFCARTCMTHNVYYINGPHPIYIIYYTQRFCARIVYTSPFRQCNIILIILIKNNKFIVILFVYIILFYYYNNAFFICEHF